VNGDAAVNGLDLAAFRPTFGKRGPSPARPPTYRRSRPAGRRTWTPAATFIAPGHWRTSF
jgi:hypothetical protein